MARIKDEALHVRRRKEITLAAERCFAEKGLRQTTMQEICEAASISAGTLYHYFPSKDDIISALAEEEGQENRELLTYLRGEKDVVKGLKRATPDIIKSLSDPMSAKLLIEIAAEASRNPEIGAPFQAMEAEFITALRGLLDAGQRAGTVDPKLDTDATAFLLLSILDGLGGQYAFPVEVSKRRVIKTVQTVFERLLRPPNSN